MVKENHRWNYYSNNPEKSMNVFAHYYDKGNACSSEDLQDMIDDHERCRRFWDEKLNKLLPILMKRFSNVELQIFYSCIMSHQQYTQTHVTQFVTYKDSNGERQYFTQAAINGYIKRIKKIIVLEDEFYEEGVKFTKECNKMLNHAQYLSNKLNLILLKNRSKLLVLRKIKKQLKKYLKIVAIEKKIKERKNLNIIKSRLSFFSMLGNKMVEPIIKD